MDSNSFLKKTTILLVGSGFSQVINFAITSILTRLYAPEQFGSQVVFATIAFYFSLIFTGKFELAIVIPVENSKAKSIAFMSFRFLLLLSTISIPLFFINCERISQFLNQPNLVEIIWLIPASIIILGASNILNSWHTRMENYKLLTAVRILETVITGIISLLLFHYNLHGLIFGMIIGSGFASGLMYYYFRKQKLEKEIIRYKYIDLAKEYFDFPRHNILISLVDAFQFTGITLIISFYFGPVPAGYFALCNRVLQAPIGLLIKPISQVFIAESSKLVRNQGKLFPFSIAIVKRTSLISSIILIVILVEGPLLFSFIFGKSWYISGVYAQIMIPWFFIEFIKVPISQISVILRKQHILLFFNLLSFILFLTLPYFFEYLTSTPKIFLIYLMLFHSIAGVYMTFWFLNLAKNYDYKKPN